MKRYSAFFSVLAIAAFSILAVDARAQDSIGVATTASGDRYLVDSKGMTLYYYTKDKTGDSDCNGNCLKAWPAFYAPSVWVSAPLDAADFGTITRADGAKQTTYMGWPLYYWVRDKQPGDMTSEGSGAANPNWPAFSPDSFVVPSALDPADFKTIVRGDGTRQATYKGYPLYYFVKDQKRGDVAGQGVKDVWYVIDPAKFPVQ